LQRVVSFSGILLVFAAGNTFMFGDQTSLQPFTNSRFVISVGAVDKDGFHASYSTSGPNLFVTSPGGSTETPPNHVVANLGGGCHDAKFGTSLATPVVSGVLALMLEAAHGNLTWRDVQWILATSSRIVDNDPFEEHLAVSMRNAAGVWHSQWYGFGIINVAAAVHAAQNWTTVEEESSLAANSGRLDLPLSDGPLSNGQDAPIIVSTVEITTTTTTAANDTDDYFAAESVAVFLTLSHSSRGHLRIALTSPLGTTSVLHPGKRPENSQDETRWQLLSLQFWGENAIGEWTLSIQDVVEGDVDECVNGVWQYAIENVGLSVDCADLERTNLCQDGELDPSSTLDAATYNAIFVSPDERGLVPADDCCACGGGKPASEVADVLHHWRLVVYGTTDQEAVDLMLSANWNVDVEAQGDDDVGNVNGTDDQNVNGTDNDSGNKDNSTGTVATDAPTDRPTLPISAGVRRTLLSPTVIGILVRMSWSWMMPR
jgi:subtilisin-like proprotein convertase family protein